MTTRSINSRFYGNLGVFRQIAPKLYRNESGRTYLLGEGSVGGKGEGHIFLDRICDRHCFSVPAPTIIVCNDFPGLPPVPLTAERKRQYPKIASDTVKAIIDVARSTGLPKELIMRSSAVIEDQMGQTAAGIFRSLSASLDFTRDTVPAFEITDFAGKINEVAASLTGADSLAYHELRGLLELTPLALLLQPMIGSYWFNNELYGPHLSGIMNTATPGLVKMATVVGLGEVAVGPAGAGVFCAYSYNGEVQKYQAGLPRFSTFSRRGKPDVVSLFDINFRSVHNRILDDETAGEQLVPLAVKISEEVGMPLDFEWAWVKGEPVHLLQVRPLKTKQKSFPKPQVSQSQKLLETEWAIGQGEATINHVIIADEREGVLFRHLIGETAKRYSDNLLLLLRDEQNPANGIKYSTYCWSKAVILADCQADRFSGSGLQHLALNIHDEAKIVLYAEGDNFKRTLEKEGKLVEEIPAPYDGQGAIKVYALNQSVKVAADDENGWGMVYFG